MSAVASHSVIPEFAGSMAWRAGELRDEEWRKDLPAEVLRELRAAVAQAGAHAARPGELRVQDFALESARGFMAEVRRQLQQGRGFVLLHGLPVREWGKEASTVAYWLLSSLLARPVAQKLDGTLVYDVQDTGREALPGSGVRPDKTNIEQYFHNDNAYSVCPPEYVGLLCLQPAVEGGRSGVASIRTVHNELRRRHPEALARLYQPFLFDRQKEHAPTEPGVLSAPIFAVFDGDLKMRMGLYPLLNAYKLPGNALDEAGARAIGLLKDVLADPGLCHHFTMAAGDMQFVNNLGTCHRRTAFVDHPVDKRHLVRLWLRDAGGPGYDG